MKGPYAEWRKLARRVGVAALLVLGLWAVSAGAPGIHRPTADGRAAQHAEDEHTRYPSLCLHVMHGTGSALHCHTVTAAARAIVPEWSPDPKDTLSDDGVVAALPRAASVRLPPPRVPASGPPAFILFANFRS